MSLYFQAAKQWLLIMNGMEARGGSVCLCSHAYVFICMPFVYLNQYPIAHDYSLDFTNINQSITACIKWVLFLEKKYTSFPWSMTKSDDKVLSEERNYLLSLSRKEFTEWSLHYVIYHLHEFNIRECFMSWPVSFLMGINGFFINL